MSGDHVLAGDWIGVVEEVFEEALIKIQNRVPKDPKDSLVRVCDFGGSLVVGEEPPPGNHSGNIPSNDGGSTWSSYLRSISSAFSASNPNPDSQKSNKIIDVRQTVVCINWLGMNQKLDMATQAFKPRPKRYYTGKEISNLLLVRNSDDSFQIGDRVVSRFANERSLSNLFGFKKTEESNEEDTFQILRTSSNVEILWQNGSKSTEFSKDLIPYLNLDEFDVWPGDFVLWNSEEDEEDSKVGIVQSMDPEERTALIRWYETEEQPVTLPVMELDLSGKAIEPISFGIRRGDEVLISKTSNGLTLPQVGRIGEVEDLDEDEIRENLSRLGMKLAKENQITTPRYLPKRLGLGANDPMEVEEEKEIDWFGIVLDLDLIGNVKIKLPGGTLIWETIDKLSLLMDGFENDWSSEEEDDSDDEEEYESSEFETDDEDDSKVPSKKIQESEWEDVEEDSIMKDIKVATPTSTDSALPSTSLIPSIVPTLPPSISAPDFPTPNSRWSSFEILETLPSDHHFATTPCTPPSKAFFSRISKEFKALKSSLPSSILVRSFETRSDLLRVLIIGSAGTPFEDAPFMIDFHLENYPHSPPKAFFHSFTNGNGRVSPNMYEDGKICLSLLGTWNGDHPSESWNSETSTLLQVFVSISSLVLVVEPYFTEPAFEKFKTTPEGRLNSRLYSEKSFVLSRGFIRRALEKGLIGLEDEIRFFYLGSDGYEGRLKRVLERSEELIQQSERLRVKAKEKVGVEAEGMEVDQVKMIDQPIERLSSGGTIVLRRTLTALGKVLEQKKS